MDFKDRRRLILGKSLLPLIIWNNKMSSLEEIPVEYTTTGASVVYSASGNSIEITSIPGMMTQNFVFKIPKKYVKKAKTCNIVWYIKTGYLACNVKLVCDGQTLTDTGTENSQTRIFTPDISAFTDDMTITFTGSEVRIYNLILE